MSPVIQVLIVGISVGTAAMITRNIGSKKNGPYLFWGISIVMTPLFTFLASWIINRQ